MRRSIRLSLDGAVLSVEYRNLINRFLYSVYLSTARFIYRGSKNAYISIEKTTPSTASEVDLWTKILHR